MMAASLIMIKELPPEISEKNSFNALYNQVSTGSEDFTKT